MSNEKKADGVRLSLDDFRLLSTNALIRAGASDLAANSLAAAFVAAEADGMTNHGLARLFGFCGDFSIGKINGHAVPVVSQPKPGQIVVDAQDGLAHVAIDAGLEPVVSAARSQGIAALVIRNAHSAHVLGYHTERIAKHGLLVLGFANAPASIAPPGHAKGVFGTNPISLAVPRRDGDPILIDQAASVVAKSEIVDRAAADQPIPLGWALDVAGEPTTSAADALRGTMVPNGGAKGLNVAFIVEAFAAIATGGVLAIDAPSFADRTSGPMKLGQCFIVMDLGVPGRDHALAAVERVVDAYSAQQARLPGSRRLKNRCEAMKSGITVDRELYEKLRHLSN